MAGLVGKLYRAADLNGRKEGSEKKIHSRLRALADMLDRQAHNYCRTHSQDPQNDANTYEVGFRIHVMLLPVEIRDLVVEFKDSFGADFYWDMSAMSGKARKHKYELLIDICLDDQADRVLLGVPN